MVSILSAELVPISHFDVVEYDEGSAVGKMRVYIKVAPHLPINSGNGAVICSIRDA